LVAYCWRRKSSCNYQQPTETGRQQTRSVRSAISLVDLEGDGDLKAVISDEGFLGETVWLNQISLVYLPVIKK
jgi:hypothetical protein